MRFIEEKDPKVIDLEKNILDIQSDINELKKRKLDSENENEKNDIDIKIANLQKDIENLKNQIANINK